MTRLFFSALCPTSNKTFVAHTLFGTLAISVWKKKWIIIQSIIASTQFILENKYITINTQCSFCIFQTQLIEEYEEHHDVWLAIKLPRCYLKTLSEVIFLVQFDCVIVDQISKVLLLRLMLNELCVFLALFLANAFFSSQLLAFLYFKLRADKSFYGQLIHLLLRVYDN